MSKVIQHPTIGNAVSLGEAFRILEYSMAGVDWSVDPLDIGELVMKNIIRIFPVGPREKQLLKLKSDLEPYVEMAGGVQWIAKAKQQHREKKTLIRKLSEAASGLDPETGLLIGSKANKQAHILGDVGRALARITESKETRKIQTPKKKMSSIKRAARRASGLFD